MKKYLIVLKGESNTGKTTVLKLLGEKLRKEYEFKSWKIGACEKNKNEYLKKKVNNCLLDKLDKDVFLDGKINNKRVIISTGGDYVRCIDRFLEKFENNDKDDDVFIGITACQCEDKSDSKCLKLLNEVKDNNVVFITTCSYNLENDNNLYEKLNWIKVDELFKILEEITNEQ